ncbi:MAG: NepR family anti-sigma factor [Pseudomonadota bacterium]
MSLVKKRRNRMPSGQDDAFDHASNDRLQKLAESLREQFDDIRDEPIPQNLQDLVEALRAAEKNSQTRH